MPSSDSETGLPLPDPFASDLGLDADSVMPIFARRSIAALRVAS